MKGEIEQVLHMVGGSGETSYATNSRLQEKAISKAKLIVEESISMVLYSTLESERLLIADLGCSSGPTTFMVISEIMSAISEICGEPSCRPVPEVLFLLNDLPGNDFNTIFKSLAWYQKKACEEGKEGKKLGPYYVAGVPGSFYGRLFPKASVHFVHSSYSLHWLSQVPQGLENEMGVPINQRNMYIAKESPPSVFKLYLQQFQQDFSTFLTLRSEEIMSGGQMVLTFMGRHNEDPLTGDMSDLMELLAEALNTMVSEGLVEEATVNAFDLPFYAPSIDEVRAVVLSEGSFDLRRELVFELNWDPFDDQCDDLVVDNTVSGGNAAKCIRAALEPMFASHFGEAILDNLFSRYGKNIAEYLSKRKNKHVNFTVALKKRG